MAHEGLMEQDLSGLDVTQLHPLSPQVISRQASINVVTTGGESIVKETVVLSPILILQDKVDLIEENEAKNQHEEMQRFIKAAVVDGAPRVPITSAGVGIDVVWEYIMMKIPIPERDYVSPAIMDVYRSSDPNKPVCGADELTGGEVGGCILRGALRVGDLTEIRPGIVSKDENGNIRCAPILSKIASLYAEQNELQFAVPGALIAVGTTIDPTLSIADKLVGQVLGAVGSLPKVYVQLKVTFFLLRRLLGKGVPVSKLCKGDSLMVYRGAMATRPEFLK